MNVLTEVIDMEDKIFFSPGDVVTIRQNIPNKPTMLVDRKVNNMISKDVAKAHTDGFIYIHDLDFYALTLTCCQIDCLKLFKGGFNTGHGHLREPNSIGSYATLAAIAIQSNQNDQHRR